MESLKELDKIGTELLTKLPEMMQAGTVYASDLMARFVKYAVVINSMRAVVAIILIVIFVTISYKCFVWVKSQDGEHLMPYAIVHLLGLALIYAPLITILCTSIQNIITLTYVPEIYIINYFK